MKYIKLPNLIIHWFEILLPSGSLTMVISRIPKRWHFIIKWSQEWERNLSWVSACWKWKTLKFYTWFMGATNLVYYFSISCPLKLCNLQFNANNFPTSFQEGLCYAYSENLKVLLNPGRYPPPICMQKYGVIYCYFYIFQEYKVLHRCGRCAWACGMCNHAPVSRDMDGCRSLHSHFAGLSFIHLIISLKEGSVFLSTCNSIIEWICHF